MRLGIGTALRAMMFALTVGLVWNGSVGCSGDKEQGAGGEELSAEGGEAGEEGSDKKKKKGKGKKGKKKKAK